MARRGLKLMVTGQGEDVVGLTSILDLGQFSSLLAFGRGSKYRNEYVCLFVCLSLSLSTRVT